MSRSPRETSHAAFDSFEGFVELRTQAAEEARRILLDEPPRNPVVPVL